jgi:FixJ family two-component response regulator
MLRLLVADKDINARKQIAGILIEAGYDVMVTDSAVGAMRNVLHNNARVLLLGTELEELSSAELLPLLKQCNRRLAIILVADEASLPLMRKVRKEGIFYHALRPAESEGKEEIRQVVKYAIHNLSRTPGNHNILVH